MSIHFHLCKNKNMIKDLTPDMDSANKTLHSLCLIKEGHTPGDVSNVSVLLCETVNSV